MADKFYCAECNNTGWVDCHCGGDLCVCENNGEEICPACGGDAYDDDYLEDDFYPEGENDGGLEEDRR